MDVFSDLAILFIALPTWFCVDNLSTTPHWAYNQGSGMETLRLMEAGRLG